MNIEKVKSELGNHLGDSAIIKYYLGRNKYEEYRVIIKELYSRVFLVELDDEKTKVKSFSYSDIITKTIKINFNL
jgi:uncharacterized protein Veg